MHTCSIGTTTQGKDVRLNLSAWKGREVSEDFEGFSERDRFDAILLADFLLFREMRRSVPDPGWLQALEILKNHGLWTLGASRFKALRIELGVTSAFTARDYGQRLAHAHFNDFSI